MESQKGYRDLKVWQTARRLATEVFRATESFPKSEMFGLQSQMRRAGVSIASNIAEGWGRMGSKELVQFCGYARGSLMELQTQIEIACDLNLMDRTLATNLVWELDGLSVALYKLIQSTGKSEVREQLVTYTFDEHDANFVDKHHEDRVLLSLSQD